MKVILLFILLLQSFCCKSNTFPRMDEVYLIDELLMIEYKAMTGYQVLDQDDFETIDAYLKWFFNLQTHNKTINEKDESSLLFFIKVLKVALIENKLPRKYIPDLMKFAIAVNGFENSKGYYLNTSKLIWYLEYRSIKDENKAISFLLNDFNKNSSTSLRKIIKLLVVDSRYQQIEKWDVKEKIINPNQLIRLMKREDKIINSLSINIDEFVRLLIEDYELTVRQVFTELTKSKVDYEFLNLLFSHNDWLFLQIHKNSDNFKINNFLDQIYVDWMTLNSSSLVKKLPIQNELGSRYEIFEWINNKMGVYKKILEIREIISKPSSRYGQNKHEKALRIKNKEFIKQKLSIFEVTFIKGGV